MVPDLPRDRCSEFDGRVRCFFDGGSGRDLGRVGRARGGVGGFDRATQARSLISAGRHAARANHHRRRRRRARAPPRMAPRTTAALVGGGGSRGAAPAAAATATATWRCTRAGRSRGATMGATTTTTTTTTTTGTTAAATRPARRRRALRRGLGSSRRSSPTARSASTRRRTRRLRVRARGDGQAQSPRCAACVQHAYCLLSFSLSLFLVCMLCYLSCYASLLLTRDRAHSTIYNLTARGAPPSFCAPPIARVTLVAPPSSWPPSFRSCRRVRSGRCRSRRASSGG